MEPGLDPLTQTALRSMHDIIVPEPVSWMPQTWGWAVVAVCLFIAVLIAVAAYVRHYRKNAYRREALRLLDEICTDMQASAALSADAFRLAELVKRTALAAWPRADVASLSGDDWIAFLNHTSKDSAGDALKDVLKDLEYQKADSAPPLPAKMAEDLTAATRRWIETHHVSA
ncbi:DUF4381 domain-containing protein [Aureimonas fodinaquatilis]|uniref:DUF4381 domain-containing protein n=1 Tax=Aureimonas fodinaquatilis TaxID=2565783 RepID=A0A5B0DRB2_9HYPH|nr:DUF4381 domain-containing protein [Aureimonas fodinaquatilis]KAA0968913.1 DUF4381 domain-containing protein [Aureimonas fodinaquatilis]